MADVKAFEGETESHEAKTIVSTLLQKGIKLLALDFDKTLLDIHTGGSWRGPSTKLVDHVRPCMKALLLAALGQPSLEVCIVTYSTQPWMIEDVLKKSLINCDVSRILIRAVTKDWQPQGASAASTKSPDFLGKEEHLVRVLTDLYNLRRVIIQSHEVFLVDDDAENVRLAKQFGHVAFKVEDDVELSDIVSFVEGLPLVRSSDVVVLPTENAASDGNRFSCHSSNSIAEANTGAEFNIGDSSGKNPVGAAVAGGKSASEDTVQPDWKRSNDNPETAVDQ